MNKVISFEKQIACNTSIEEITSIAVDQDLDISDDYVILGNVHVYGTYKMLKTSIEEQDFSYNIPVEIEIDNRYILDDSKISIDDFKYEIVDDEFINIKVDLLLSNLNEKPEEISAEILDVFPTETDDNRVSKETVSEIEEDINENNNQQVESLFTKFLDDEDTYSTYKVYMIRENDSIESIIEKYNITKEELNEYNDLENIGINDKIIIPYHEKS